MLNNFKTKATDKIKSIFFDYNQYREEYDDIKTGWQVIGIAIGFTIGIVLVFLMLMSLVYPFAYQECKTFANLNQYEYRVIYPSGNCIVKVDNSWIGADHIYLKINDIQKGE